MFRKIAIAFGLALVPLYWLSESDDRSTGTSSPSVNAALRERAQTQLQGAFERTRTSRKPDAVVETDPWGGPLRYESRAPFFTVSSAGPDGVLGNDDDLYVDEEYELGIEQERAKSEAEDAARAGVKTALAEYRGRPDRRNTCEAVDLPESLVRLGLFLDMPSLWSDGLKPSREPPGLRYEGGSIVLGNFCIIKGDVLVRGDDAPLATVDAFEAFVAALETVGVRRLHFLRDGAARSIEIATHDD